MNPTRAIVIGGTSGIGLEIVRQLTDRGAKVAVVGRDFSELGEFNVIQKLHDVKDTDAIPQVFLDLTDQLGGLDLFVYSAGVMPLMQPSEFDTPKDLEIISVNVSGAVAWMNQAASRFYGAQHGCLIAIGSVAGDRGRAGQPVYNASKAFVHTYTESLRNRLARRGVSVITVKPGPTRTRMTAYHDQSKMMDPAVAASKVLRLIGRQGEFYLNPVHALVGFVFRHIPGWLMRRIRI
ncbi:MAG: SDR family oxidoreductase [Chthonomonas sp.]|nr:SDR family oxidoreductase [Chthonomonas sp.]